MYTSSGNADLKRARGCVEYLLGADLPARWREAELPPFLQRQHLATVLEGVKGFIGTWMVRGNVAVDTPPTSLANTRKLISYLHALSDKQLEAAGALSYLNFLYAMYCSQNYDDTVDEKMARCFVCFADKAPLDFDVQKALALEEKTLQGIGVCRGVPGHKDKEPCLNMRAVIPAKDMFAAVVEKSVILFSPESVEVDPDHLVQIVI